ncbi:MAG: hypothetical protein EXR79_00315 [Myxococcales bacterium]|nr:hypothetical protein [Myxococcales bacterium]
MKVSLAPPRLDVLDEIAADLVVLTGFADDRPLVGLTGLIDWRLNGRLSHLVLTGFIDGHFRETLLLPSGHRLPFPRAVYIGMGRRAEFSPQRFDDTCRHCFATLRGLGVSTFAMALPGRVGLDVGLRQALAGWRRALADSFSAAELAVLDVTLLEPAEVQRELVEPMRTLERDLIDLRERTLR